MGTATHYADSSTDKINRAKRTIAWILRERRGKGAAISSKGLADATGPKGIEATTCRDLIPEIRREQGIPIASCPGGYYVVSSTEDLEDHLERIDDEIDTRLERKRELTAAFNKYSKVGRELELISRE